MRRVMILLLVLVGLGLSSCAGVQKNDQGQNPPVKVQHRLPGG